MVKSIKNSLKRFLSQHSIQGRILLGFSGGVDSMVLLDLLLKMQKKYSLEIHLAHIDHCLRKTSSKECAELKKYATTQNLPFHSIKFHVKTHKNLEDQCRKYRIQYFLKLHKKYQYTGLFLAHHADDQAETVLKKLFEGGKFFQYAALKKESYYQNLIVFRPLLSFPKEQIQNYAKQYKLSFIKDFTNFDRSNLRSIMRVDIIPFLEKMFGKVIRKNLVRLAKQSDALSKYFEKRISHIWSQKISGPFGDYFSCEDLQDPEIAFFLYKYLKKRGIYLSFEEYETLQNWIIEEKTKKSFKVKNLQIHIDRKHIFFQTCPLHLNRWKLKVEHCPLQKCKFSHWKEILKGNVKVILPKGSYDLKVPSKHLMKKYSSKKIPNFLRSVVPVLQDEKKEEINFLFEEHLSYSQGDQKISVIFQE